MIFEHEIPKGSRLYFGKSAKVKRELENKICKILEEKDFEEIITPNFSYSQHQAIENDKKLIKFSDEQNEQVSLRADSTLDVVRIITKRLGRTTDHRKWFYIQPIFSYPSTEDYQIGCEWIDHDDILDLINVTADILSELKINPILQLSNINIPKLISKEYEIDINYFKSANVAKLVELDITWLNQLIKAKDVEDLVKIMDIIPKLIKKEVQKLLDTAKKVKYKNLIIAPLYHGSLKYYNDVYFRVFEDNLVISKGGKYSSNGISSLGFALYTDSLLKILED